MPQLKPLYPISSGTLQHVHEVAAHFCLSSQERQAAQDVHVLSGARRQEERQDVGKEA
jgi:hypothetical protein